MKVEYDASVDALAIFFVDKPHSIRTKEIYPDIYLDFDHGTSGFDEPEWGACA